MNNSNFDFRNEKKLFEKSLYILIGFTRNTSDLKNEQHHALQMIFFKFLQLCKSLIALDGISTIGSFIVFRSLLDLSVDAFILTAKNEPERYKRFLAFSDLDEFRNTLASIRVGINDNQINALLVQNFIELYEHLDEYEKAITILDRGNARIIVEELKEKIAKVKTVTKNEKIKIISNAIDVFLNKIRNINTWYAKKENAYDLFLEVSHGISNFKDNELDALSNYYAALKEFGNSAVHTSVALNNTCFSEADSTFNTDEDINPGLVLSFCTFPFLLMQKALCKGGLITDADNNLLTLKIKQIYN